MSRQVEVKLPVVKLIMGKTQWDEKDCGLTTVFSARCTTHPSELARIAGLMKQNVPFYLIIGTLQAELDFQMVSVEIGKPASMQLPLENDIRRQTAAMNEGEAAQAAAEKPDAIEEIAALDGLPGRKCRICGCTEGKACITDDGPCFWIEPDLCSACMNQAETDIKHNHNGHDKAGATEKPEFSFLDLTSFYYRPSPGPGVPDKVFLLGASVENDNISKGIVELFSHHNIKFDDPAALAEHLKLYPPSDNKTAIVELLTGSPYIEPPVENLQEEPVAAYKPARRGRKKKTTEAQTESPPADCEEPAGYEDPGSAKGDIEAGAEL